MLSAYNQLEATVKEVIAIFTKGFYKDLAERAIATFAETLGAILAAGGFGLLDADWLGAISAAGMATLLAILKAFAAAGLNSETGASFGTAIPKSVVAAVETDYNGQYEAEEAAPFEEGTPVDVVSEPEYAAEELGYEAAEMGHDHEEERP